MEDGNIYERKKSNILLPPINKYSEFGHHISKSLDYKGLQSKNVNSSSLENLYLPQKSTTNQTINQSLLFEGG